MKNQIFTLLLSLLFVKAIAQPKTDADMQQEIEKRHEKTTFISDSVFKLIKACDAQIKSAKDAVVINDLNLRLTDLWELHDNNEVNAVNGDLEFAKGNPNSMIALQLIRSRVSRQEGMGFYDTYETVFNHFSDAIKNSAEGKQMAEQLKYFKQSKVGSTAPEFDVKDSNGMPLSLKDYYGKKYVLIDFWASWCGPCREELPEIKKLYQKYGYEDFEIISFSRDEDLKKWKEAVTKEGIAIWKQVSTVQNNNTTLERDYFVTGIPHKVLIDKNGTIIGKWKGMGEKNKKELANMLAQVFEKN